jgi:hypothetical protein
MLGEATAELVGGGQDEVWAARRITAVMAAIRAASVEQKCFPFISAFCRYAKKELSSAGQKFVKNL